MAGYVYLIRNGDLHKIGRTDNLQRRLKQLQPCVLVQSLKTDRSRDLEHELHKRFKNRRLPQSEYFRLTEDQVRRVRIALGWNPPREVEISTPAKPVPPVVSPSKEPVTPIESLQKENPKDAQRTSGLEIEMEVAQGFGMTTGFSGLLYLILIVCIPLLPDRWGFPGYLIAGIALLLAKLIFVFFLVCFCLFQRSTASAGGGRS